jgi:hypothetical protein
MRERSRFFLVATGVFFLVLISGAIFLISRPRSITIISAGIEDIKEAVKESVQPELPKLDKEAYDAKMLAIANLPPPKPVPTSTKPAATSTATTTAPKPKPGPWPVKAAYPNAGALLPFNRIIAYYGNLYSTKMGVLGEYPETQMLDMLQAEADKWQAADPSTPSIPALHYIAVTAQGSAQEDGKYRLRMPWTEIDKVLEMAKKINALVFLDIQVALSNVQTEVPLLEKYLKMPNVHLALDPEFSMKTGKRPGTVIGSMDATDINYAAEYLAKVVRDNNLPPKILVVHRFTQPMLTNARSIKPLPEVQIVIDMDGFGPPAQKIDSYLSYVRSEPVQFTGFKLFYKNDAYLYGKHLMTPAEVLKLSPQPSYIQYQ